MPNYLRVQSLSVWILISILVVPKDAHAYLDAGTGSMLIQGLIAAALSATFTIKLFWGKLRRRFFGHSPDQEEAGHDQAVPDDRSDG